MDGTEIGIGDFNAFDAGSKTTSALKSKIESVEEKVKSSGQTLGNTSVFEGPIAENCVEGVNALGKDVASCASALGQTISDLSTIYSYYKKGDMNAIKEFLGITGENPDSNQLTDSSTVSGKTTEEYIYNYLEKAGFNKAAICGILANIQHESSFNTKSLGDHGTSYGICQWHEGRWTNLKNFCKENNLDVSSIEGQMKYLEYELKKSYKGLYNKLKNVPNTSDGCYQAAAMWTTDFESPQNENLQAKRRGKTAVSTYWSHYNNGEKA